MVLFTCRNIIKPISLVVVVVVMDRSVSDHYERSAISVAGPASQAGRAESGRLRCAVLSSQWEPNFFSGKSLTLTLHGSASA